MQGLASSRSIPFEQILQLESVYQFTVLWTDPLKQGVRLTTNCGLLEVIPVHLSWESLEFTRQAQEFLEKKGFHQLLSILAPNRFSFTSPTSILYLVVKGSKHHGANFLDACERELAIKCLAEFHLASSDFHPETEPSTEWLDLKKHYQQKWAELHELLTQSDLQSGPKNEINSILQTAYETIESVSNLPTSSITLLEQKRQGFIHGGLHVNSFLIGEQCELKLPPHFYLQRGFRIQDLDQCFHLILKQIGWQTDLGNELLKTYETIFPLTDIEKETFAYGLLFPSTLLSYLQNSQPSNIYHLSFIQDKIRVEQEEIQRRSAFVKSLLA